MKRSASYHEINEMDENGLIQLMEEAAQGQVDHLGLTSTFIYFRATDLGVQSMRTIQSKAEQLGLPFLKSPPVAS